jgi:hypothetical protein
MVPILPQRRLMPFSEENEEKVRENSNKAMPFRKKKERKKRKKNCLTLQRVYNITSNISL